MKKLVLFFALTAVVAFSACSNKQQTVTPATTPVDTTAAAPAPAPAAPADTAKATPAK